MNFKNKHILISGASSGIGFALAGELLREGAEVTNFDVKEPEKTLGGLRTLIVDITHGKAISESLKELKSPVDILVCNAGVMRRGNLMESSGDDFDLLFNVNVKGTWLLLKNAVKSLSPNATVVFMASRYSLKPRTDPALYSISKLTQYQLGLLAKETFSDITFKFILPGSTDTPLSRYGVSGRALKEKEKRMQSPAFLAVKVLKLLSSDKEYLIFDEEAGEYRME